MRQMSIDEENETSLNPEIDHQPVSVVEKCHHDVINHCSGLTLLER